MDLIISLNKPGDISSQDAVTKVKKILKAKKAGHTGTLDPMATGLLLVCLDRATRLASYFSDLDKEYTAVMKLGETTDTQDAYGKIIAKNDVLNIDKEIIEETLKFFEGSGLQQPPMFSALKHKGEPLYKLARKGLDVERKSREIMIHRIELIDMDIPYVRFRAVCSKGTYIRTLCDDIGKKLGTGAHMSGLERTAIGSFNIKDSLTFDELRKINIHDPAIKGVYSMDEALSWLPELTISESLVKPVMHGNPLRLNSGLKLPAKPDALKGIKIKSPDGELIAVGRCVAEKNVIKMDIVFGE